MSLSNGSYCIKHTLGQENSGNKNFFTVERLLVELAEVLDFPLSDAPSIEASFYKVPHWFDLAVPGGLKHPPWSPVWVNKNFAGPLDAQSQ